MPTPRDPVVTSRIMAAVRGKNTRPEVALRKQLFACGLRYRLHDRRLPGKPDLVFASARLVVFVDGDFWHGGGWKERGLKRFEDQFGSNRDFWIAKITRNVERDREVEAALQRLGWTVERVLESEVMKDVDAVAQRIARRVAKTGTQG